MSLPPTRENLNNTPLIMKNATIHFTVEKTDTGFSAYADNEGIYTTGSDYNELLANMTEAAELYFEEENVKFKLIPNLDLAQFFDYYKVINAKALSERIGMNQSLLAQYIRGLKKPSPKQTERIIEGVREVGKELSNIQFMARA